MQYGYARVSTFDQNLELQLEALRSSGCDRIFEDKISGAKSKRPGLDKLIKVLRPGDTVVVWKLDRMGRSLIHLVELLNFFLSNNIEFISVTEGIKISTSIGRFAYTMLSAAAELERENIIERTRAGLAVARANGRIGGRRSKLTPEQWEQAGRLLAQGVPRKQVALIYDVALSTLYKKHPAKRTCIESNAQTN
ncbi:recombinase family protein [Salmonella enterica subsp. enterica serovar Corvallis]|uniref:DNA-invertase n=1 Tax=Salmonella phage SJ46 TaxID=1815968 RepID=A0A1B0VBM1_9CAUD|nr:MULTISPECIES: recombinase family protein [Enterobacteriaceae]YP_009293493.1 DNA invertase [Salmonella phage SJ46]EAB9511631.1 recombinase family protein [Salmonella enterica subsp. enterica serovar Monschaui]ECD6375615.1 recombinase family protein [Salmonella enterica subsp. enterica serovar Kentucky]MBJ3687973.1 recombinase family protein [Salmonella enterica subsp. enterica serovar Corvallis]MBJ5313507.1 recombinase family protein [Salmonella enterica subsp. enterica serovar Dabou]MCR364